MMDNMTIMIPKILEKWWPTNLDSISWLSSPISSSKPLLASHATHGSMNDIAFWIHGISWSHCLGNLIHERTKNVVFVFFWAGCLIKINNIVFTRTSNQFCGQPNIFIWPTSSYICRMAVGFKRTYVGQAITSINGVSIANFYCTKLLLLYSHFQLTKIIPKFVGWPVLHVHHSTTGTVSEIFKHLPCINQSTFSFYISLCRKT